MGLPATHHDPRSPVRWELEQIQRRLLEITCEQLGVSPDRVSLETRFTDDLGVESLDLVEYVMAVEEEFHVQIDDETAHEFFPNRIANVGQLAEIVTALTGAAQPRRIVHAKPGPGLVPVEVVPCTQLGGKLAASEWQAGALYESLGCNREGHPQYRRRTDGMRCILVPEGETWIGSTESDALPDQRPGHPVRLGRFLIDAEPVSNRAFARFLNSVGPVDSPVLREWCLLDSGDRREKHFPLRRSWWCGWQAVGSTEQQPIILVSWYGANAYSLWANRRDWRRYRGDGSVPVELQDMPVEAEPPPEEWLGSFLPSEAQWEYAARGGTARRYPWGDEPPTAERLRAACHVPGATYTVDTLPAARVSECLGMSPFGLHHMAGNVWQWCRDWYAADFYQRPEALQPDAQNRAPTGICSERGGSWVGPERLAGCAYRRGRPPQASGRCLGFRCVGLARDLS